MARIRTIKPEFWSSEDVVSCSRDARLLFVGMWNFCDDQGVMPANERSLKMRVFPGDDDITSQTIRGLIVELMSAPERPLVVEYEVDGKRYFYVTGWHHQRIDRPSKRYPAPPTDESQWIIRRTLDERSPPEGSLGSLRKEGSLSTYPPTPLSARRISERPTQNQNGGGGDFEEQARSLTTWFIARREHLFANSADLPAPFVSIQTLMLTWLGLGLPQVQIQATLDECMAAAAGKGARPPHSPKAYARSLEDALRRFHDASGDAGAPSEADIAAARRRQAEKDAKLRRVSDLRQAHSAAQGRLRAAVKAEAPEAERQEIVAECDRIAVELEQAEAVDA